MEKVKKEWMSPELTEENKKVLALTSKKHVKIYLLSKTTMKKIDIARLLGTNAGHVNNVINDYKAKPEKAKEAELLML